MIVSRSMTHTQVASAFTGEAITCSGAIQLGLDLRYSKVIVEGNSLSVIKKGVESTSSYSCYRVFEDRKRTLSGSRSTTFCSEDNGG